MSNRDLNEVAKIERAISKKYGRETIQNPKSGWTKEKEESYLQDLKEVELERKKEEQLSEKVEIGGFLVSKKLLNRKVVANCPVCSKKLRNVMDDICMNKYESCEKCYIFHIEGREERWLSGWRPKTGEK
tara:strand:+ start:3645 stop:4034 length:390 start_codon:yes stop_codon:yes gene_type:complete